MLPKDFLFTLHTYVLRFLVEISGFCTATHGTIYLRALHMNGQTLLLSENLSAAEYPVKGSTLPFYSFQY